MKIIRPSLEYPEVPLYWVLENSAERWGDKVGVIYEDREIYLSTSLKREWAGSPPRWPLWG